MQRAKEIKEQLIAAKKIKQIYDAHTAQEKYRKYKN